MANFFTDIAPNVIFSKDPTAVIDYYVQHKLLGDVCNCPTCQSSMEMATRPTTSTKDGFEWRCANQRCCWIFAKYYIWCNISEKVSHDDLSDSSLIFGTLYILKL
jgi:hypothetical protein